jgi:hypothetical protein
MGHQQQEMPFTISVHKWTGCRAAHSNKISFRVNCYQGTYQYRSGPITNANTLTNWENDLLKKNLGGENDTARLSWWYVSKDTKTSAAKSPVSQVHFSTNYCVAKPKQQFLFYRRKLCLCTQLQVQRITIHSQLYEQKKKYKKDTSFLLREDGNPKARQR